MKSLQEVSTDMKGLLWEPFQLGKMALRNRIVMPPMVVRYADDNGYVTERNRNYYEARARGGVALVIVEATFVHKSGQAFINQLGISDDSFLPGMKHLVQAIHRQGAKSAIQLHHGGRTANSKLSGLPVVAPSPIPLPGGEMPQELTAENIADMVAAFAEAAVRAREAGFDGVEIHGAHGYLVDQFLSGATNKRQDAYGGSHSKRARFLIEVIKAIKEAAGNDLAVWCRINGQEYGVEGGTTPEEAQETARLAESAGIEAIHVSGFGPGAPNNLTTPKFTTGVIMDAVEGIKRVVNVPVIAVGRITPEAGEKILKEGKADLIAIGKALLADPDLPEKAAAGRMADVTPCIICNNCRDDIRKPELPGIRCSVNATLGREAESKIVPASKPKNILIAGGGPAGMEAARAAALRGHRVTLYEKETRLGGQLIQAAIPPHKDRIAPLVSYLERQLNQLGVEIKLGTEATTKTVEELKPDVVVLATGVKPFIPDIPGVTNANVVQAGDVLEGGVETGNRVVVIGGELVGCEVAEFLADQGKKVTVARRGAEMAVGIGPSLRNFVLSRLAAKGVTLLPGIKYREITPEGLAITTAEGEPKTIPADTVVLAAGAVPDNQLYDKLQGKAAKVHCIGDCVQPRTIRDAIAEGFRVGSQI
jgi:2,4-dienoyl-CoA reductase-like NADH-dependent reductase (Old Yellow Enzyme family)/thioredoxin reductase